MNAKKQEKLCHSSTFSIVCRKLQDVAEIMMKTVRTKRIRNISDEELSALKSLKFNKNIVICKTEQKNCIVILDKIEDI